jgi:protein-S-isoprenylcysteine O-methyltransferase Ste14
LDEREFDRPGIVLKLVKEFRANDDRGYYRLCQILWRWSGAVRWRAGGRACRIVAGVIALPPLIFIGFLAAVAVLEAIVPLPIHVAHALARYVAGTVLTAGGFVMMAMGSRRFVAAGTNIPPTLPTTALVVDGIYGRTRNPLYLGLFLIYLGLGVAAESPWAMG